MRKLSWVRKALKKEEHVFEVIQAHLECMKKSTFSAARKKIVRKG